MFSVAEQSRVMERRGRGRGRGKKLRSLSMQAGFPDFLLPVASGAGILMGTRLGYDVTG